MMEGMREKERGKASRRKCGEGDREGWIGGELVQVRWHFLELPLVKGSF